PAIATGTRLPPASQLFRRAHRTDHRDRYTIADDISPACRTARSPARTTAAAADHFRLRAEAPDPTRTHAFLGRKKPERRHSPGSGDSVAGGLGDPVAFETKRDSNQGSKSVPRGLSHFSPGKNSRIPERRPGSLTWIFPGPATPLPPDTKTSNAQYPTPNWKPHRALLDVWMFGCLDVRCLDVRWLDVRWLDVRCWMFDVGCWMLDVGCSMLDVRCSMFDVGCSIFDVRCSTLLP